MKSFLKFVFMLIVVAVGAAVVASIVSKKKLESMSDDEIREYLAIKLTGKVGDEQLASIQDAVVTGVRGKTPPADHYVEEVEEAMDDLDHVVDDVADEAEEVAATE
ncbi:MAG: hypothetical protein ABFR95_02775 [Actinomycetota bacterium]